MSGRRTRFLANGWIALLVTHPDAGFRWWVTRLGREPHQVQTIEEAEAIANADDEPDNRRRPQNEQRDLFTGTA